MYSCDSENSCFQIICNNAPYISKCTVFREQLLFVYVLFMDVCLVMIKTEVWMKVRVISCHKKLIITVAL